VESLPSSGLIGDWVVSGRTVHVSAETRIDQEDGPVAVGAEVEVKGRMRSDGSVDATKIEVKRSSGDHPGDQMVKFYAVESLPSSGLIGDWVVSGRTVHVSAETRIDQEDGPVAVGARVEVKGWLQSDNSVNATKIEVKSSSDDGPGNHQYVKFYGTVESLPANGLIGEWVVSGRTVHVGAETRIDQEDGPVAVGARVEVEGWLQSDNSVNATKIETKSSSGGNDHPGDQTVKFYGTVESLPANGLIGEWVVSGYVVHVTSATRIEQEHGVVQVGAYVEVKGSLQSDGSVNAYKVEVKISTGGGSGRSHSYAKFYGIIESLPNTPGWIGDWTVGGRTVRVSAATRIEQEDGIVAVGAYVEVKGWAQSDGSVDATKIEVKAAPGGMMQASVKFYGTVRQLPEGGLVGTWIVGDRAVQVSDLTRIEQEHGPVQVGAYVEVHGWLQSDGSVQATKIEVKEDFGGGSHGEMAKFYGTIEKLPAGGMTGDWIVSGRLVRVSNTTRIEARRGSVQVGAYIEVEGRLQSDGSMNAVKIEVKSTGHVGGGSMGFVKFYGVVEDLPASGLIGDWVVNGRIVRVSASTRIEMEHGQVRMGSLVEVKGAQQADGSVTAYKIEVKR
ncbi:MAG: hypothetical protein GXP39_13005, partial [Chloroflexi bacterium]|nr:hypothetical protein [Chloroflexota bacterium]